MTAYVLVSPKFEIGCDRPGCLNVFVANRCWDAWSARLDAHKEGWDIRPPRGKGSRSTFDYCPEHAPMPRRWER